MMDFSKIAAAAETATTYPAYFTPSMKKAVDHFGFLKNVLKTSKEDAVTMELTDDDLKAAIAITRASGTAQGKWIADLMQAALDARQA